MEHLSIICIALLLVYANGSNDNVKGVASLLGSGVTSYEHAISWATEATLLGSCAAFLLAGGLLATCSGKGLVPDAVAAMPVVTGAAASMQARRFCWRAASTCPSPPPMFRWVRCSRLAPGPGALVGA